MPVSLSTIGRKVKMAAPSILVHQIEVLFRHVISQIMLGQPLKANCPGSIIRPRRDDVLTLLAPPQCSEWCLTQAILPPVTWSSVENRLASRKGGSNVVQEVTPNATLLVTAAIAEMILVRFSNGSPSGARSAYHEWIVHWPLSACPDSWSMAASIGIMRTKVIRQE